MHRFFIDRNIIMEDEAILSGDEAHHLIHVLRLNPGDDIELLDGIGGRYAASVIEFGSSGKTTQANQSVRVKLRGRLPDNEPATRVTLYQGLPKQDKMDTIIQKCVEIGVHEIVPVIFSRCVSKTDGQTKKLQRYNRIAQEAAKQCVRAYTPQVTPPVSLREAIERMRAQALIIFPWEEAENGDVRKIVNESAYENGHIGIIIGPEGGITPAEADEIGRCHPNVRQATLGPRILRTETAGLTVLAIVLALTGDMGGEAIRGRRFTPLDAG